MSDEVRVQHIFRDPETGFTDAIVLPIADYELLDVDTIEALKAERIQAHRTLLAEVAARPAPSEVEVAAAAAVELEAVRSQKAVLDAREVELISVVAPEALVDEPVVKLGR